MKELTALDIHYLVKELKQLEASKVDQIYQPEDVLIRFHSANLGKQILRINKKFLFITTFKEDQSNPPDFCMALRKYLKNSKLKSLKQIGFERIVCLSFQTREKELFLYIELFGKSNMFLTDEENIILSSRIVERGKRIVKKGEEYILPKKDHNFLTLSEKEFNTILKESTESLVKTLAKTLGLGGIYAEYVLKDFNKNENASEFKETNKLFEKLIELKNKPILPSNIKNHITPFETDQVLNFKTYNEALENLLTAQLKEEQANISLQPFLQKKERLEKIIETQQQSIEKLNSDIIKNSKKGELIYNNFQLVEQIFKQLNLAKQSMSWKEIKDKLKKHKTLKNIDDKQGKILIDIK